MYKISQSKSLSPSRIFVMGFIFAAILLIICTVARPESLGHNDGLSYFGAVWWTVIPDIRSLLSNCI